MRLSTRDRAVFSAVPAFFVFFSDNMGGAVSSSKSLSVDVPLTSPQSLSGKAGPQQSHVVRPPQERHSEAVVAQRQQQEHSRQQPLQQDALPMRLTKYDSGTYWGRVQAFQERISPRFLFVREAEARKSGDIYALAKAERWVELRRRGIDEEQLQHHVLVAQSTINASDGSVIPPPLRLAAFAPVNIPITGGMLLSTPTFANNVFWQWINQTYNAAFNWANGNKAGGAASPSPTAASGRSPSFFSSWKYNKETEELLRGYAAAVFVSVGLAVGLNSFLLRSQLQGVARRTLQAIIPYTAVASANFSNVLLMRGEELRKGIPVFNEKKECVGISRAAAWSAVTQTAVSRVVLPLPVLLLPYPLISALNAVFPLLHSQAILRVTMELSVIYGCLVGALPLAVGIFAEESDQCKQEENLRMKKESRILA